MSSHVGIDIGGSSVKAAYLDSGLSTTATATSDFYTDPDRDRLIDVVQRCVLKLQCGLPSSIGLCLPGKMNTDGSAIELSVNLPVLNRWRFDEMVIGVFSRPVAYAVISDADAAGLDYAITHPIRGRTVAISIGTGVGLSVLDGVQVVRIGSQGIGHLGLMDVGKLGDQDRIDEHGVQNTLESYIGAAALSRFRIDGKLDLEGLSIDDPSMLALVRALRVIHAIYRPDRVVLLGGVGMALETKQQVLRDRVSDGLTQLAAKNWSLEFGDLRHHAAIGAAKFAAQSV